MQSIRIRQATYSVDFIFSQATEKNGKVSIKLNGAMIRARNISLYKRLGTKCMKCGMEGVFFAKERYEEKNKNNNRWHLALYGIKNGREVKLTKDHIIPMSRGGKNSWDNYQVLCYYCNCNKSNKLEKQ